MQWESAKWTDVAIVILTIGIVIVSGLQWHEMHSGSADTHDLAMAAKAQADAAKAQADRMSNMSDAANKIGQAVGTWLLKRRGLPTTHKLPWTRLSQLRVEINELG
jgi:hypothetical protein